MRGKPPDMAPSVAAIKRDGRGSQPHKWGMGPTIDHGFIASSDLRRKCEECGLFGEGEPAQPQCEELDRLMYARAREYRRLSLERLEREAREA